MKMYFMPNIWRFKYDKINYTVFYNDDSGPSATKSEKWLYLGPFHFVWGSNF